MRIYLDEYERSRRLPPGHIGRKAAEERVNREYRRCHEQEDRWAKRLKKLKSLDLNQAKELVDRVCDQTGQRRIRRIVINSPDVHKHATAHYYRNQIHFKYNFIYITTLVHELTHHFVHGYGHATQFCETELILFEIVESWIKSK